MPPQRPLRLPPFLGRIARNTALDRWDYNTAGKRGGFEAVLEELGECVGGTPLEEAVDLRALGGPSLPIWTQCSQRPGGFSCGDTGSATPWRRSPFGTASPRAR